MTKAPLILTAVLDPVSMEHFDGLRREHFPPERNFLAAHVTLFHHLPGDDIDEIAESLNVVAKATNPFTVRFDAWRFLGRGVAMNVDSPELIRLRNQLAQLWQQHLTPQDRHKFQPHITIQNKVEPQTARLLYDHLSTMHKPFAGKIVGLALWSYLGGPWRLEREFQFADE